MRASRLRLCGIYRIALWNDDRGYIGSSVDIERRWRNHYRLLMNGTHHSPHLQRAWNQYGSEAFYFETLERCLRSTLIEREQYWIGTADSTFNATAVAGAPPLRVGWRHSAETRSKMSQSAMGHPVSEESRRKTGEKQRGRPGHPHDASFIERLKAERVGSGNPFYGRTHSEEARRKMSEAHQKRLYGGFVR